MPIIDATITKSAETDFIELPRFIYDINLQTVLIACFSSHKWLKLRSIAWVCKLHKN